MGDSVATEAAPFTDGKELAGLQFTDTIAPLAVEEFLDTYWENSFRHFPGKSGRFASLLPWDALNAILEGNRLQPPRLRLFRDASEVGPDRYLFFRGVGKQPVVNGPGLVNELAAGAMLVLDQVDEFVPAVRALASSFERSLGVYTSVNAYAGWGNRAGFGIHWDDHQTLMVQVSGRKLWQIYTPTREFPLRDDIENAPKPTGEPVWQGMVEDGDAMYIPRGWWHRAVPVGEPSVHLTFSIPPPDGRAFLKWLADQLRAYPLVRGDVPLLKNGPARVAWLNSLRSCLERELTGDVLDRFQRDADSRAIARPRLNLPDGVTEASRNISGESGIRLANARRLFIREEADGETLSFEAQGRKWKYPREIAPAIAALTSDKARTTDDLETMLPDTMAIQKLGTFLSLLALGGVIQVDNGRVGRS